MPAWRCQSCLKGAEYREAERADDRCACGARVPATERTALLLEAMTGLLSAGRSSETSAPSTLTYAEAARMLGGCSFRRIQELRKEGRLLGPPKIGRHPLVWRASVAALLGDGPATQLPPKGAPQLVRTPKPKASRRRTPAKSESSERVGPYRI